MYGKQCCGNCKHLDEKQECYKPEVDSLGADWDTCLNWERKEDYREDLSVNLHGKRGTE